MGQPLTHSIKQEGGLDDPRFVRLVADYVARLEAGEHPDREELLSQHPEVADALRGCLDGLELIHNVAPQLQSPLADSELRATDESARQAAVGDFYIVREIGRGGMGVVYEAQQLSLKRKVALKVLPFAAVLDPRHLQRFKNEALAAAQLEHPHIVPVYGVGCERGVHHYAMRFIEGQTLADVIAELRRASGMEQNGRVGEPLSRIVQEFVSGQHAPHSPALEPTVVGKPGSTVEPVEGQKRSAALSAEGSATSREFFRSAAKLGRNVAGALDYAHEHGVVHRDIKPSNIMLDTEGKAWVTDFGLAHIESNASLTMSGDLLGTLRYMSPEQILAKRVVIDHRTDVYSLGVTLYELLTLHAAYPETDRQTLLHHIAFEDPVPARQLNPHLPADLETIVLKTTAKNPHERYETAQALGDDLQRFLDHQPIKARRPTLRQRLAKWSLRHAALVWSAASVLLISTLVLAVSTALIYSAYHREKAALRNESAARSAETKALTDARANLEESERQRQRANEQLRLATAMRLTVQSQAIHQERPVQSLLLAMEAVTSTRRHDGSVVPIAWETLLNTIHSVGGRPLIGHQAAIESLAISSDSRWLVTASADCTARVWDLAAEDPLSSSRVLRGHTDPVRSVVIRPEGRWVVTGSDDKTARLWDFRAEDPASSSLVLGGHDAPVQSVGLGPNGRWLVTATTDRWEGYGPGAKLLGRTLRLWDLSRQDPATSWVELREPALSKNGLVAISPDGRWLVTESSDESVRVWDLSADDPTASPLVLDGSASMRSLEMSPGGRWLVTCSRTTATRWDLNAEDPASSALTISGVDLGTAVISADGRRLATIAAEVDSQTLRMMAGTEPRIARVWNLDADDPEATALILRGHQGVIHFIAISPDGHWLATASVDGTARLWDLTAANPGSSALTLRGHDNGISRVLFSPDGRSLLTAGGDGAVRLWDRDTEVPASSPLILRGRGGVHRLSISQDGRWVGTSELPTSASVWHVPADGASPSRVAVWGFAVCSPDGRWLATGSRGKTGQLWDLSAPDPASSTIPLRGHEQTVWRGAFSHDGRWLVTGSHDRTARLWDLSAENPTSSSLVLRGHGAPLGPVRFSPDGRWLVTGSWNGQARLWDLTAEDPQASGVVLTGVNGMVPLAISPDGRWLAQGGAENTVRWWNLTAEDSASPAYAFRGEGAAGLTPDGHWLIAAGVDGSVRLWDLTASDAEEASHVLRGDAGTPLAVSPDGRWLVTGNGDVARLWDLGTGLRYAPSTVLRGHEGIILAAAFSGDGQWLATGSRDATVRLWDLNIDSLIDRARRLAGRELTQQERKQYMVPAPAEP